MKVYVHCINCKHQWSVSGYGIQVSGTCIACGTQSLKIDAGSHEPKWWRGPKGDTTLGIVEAPVPARKWWRFWK